MKTVYPKAMASIVTLLLPFIILMAAVRLLITPVFAKIEYKLPGFPEDKFGFSLQERLQWSAPSIKYLVNSEDITYLSELKFEDGTSIYNDRELSHMVDVKALVQIMIKVWLGCIALILLIVILLDNLKARDILCKGFYWGGWLSIGFVLAMLLFVAINFNQLFTWFHYAFFEGDTWLFYESDTLIRLFPLRFWQDAFIFVGSFTIIVGLMFVLIFRSKRLK